MVKKSKYTVALSKDFLSCLAVVPSDQKSTAFNFVNEFKKSPTSPQYNFEKIKGAHDENMRAIRISSDYRAIVLKPEQGTVYVLLWLDETEKAYTWAANMRCVIHPDTGSLQTFKVDTTSEQATEEEVESARGTIGGLFDDYSGDELRKLGVPPQLMYRVRHLKTIEELELSSLQLPGEAYEALRRLVQDDSYGAVLRSMQEDKFVQEEVDQTDFATALTKAVSREHYTIIEDEEELRRIWNAPLEQWRVFLHRSQRKLVEADVNGPMRVLGGAGTGKTVVAMHRAIYLAENYFTKESDRLLFTTFTRNLAADIESNLRQLSSYSKLLKRIEVVSLDSWVNNFLTKQRFNKKIKYFTNTRDTTLVDLWQEAMGKIPTDQDFPIEFYREEWEQIIQAHGITSPREYMRVSRKGRGVPLGRLQRKAVWPVFEHYMQRMMDEGVCEREDALRAARHILEEKGDILPYKSVLVDEAQDMSNEAFKLIRQMVPVESGDKRRNDIFIVGDGHQRIYNHSVVLGRCGIHIVGRAWRLKINYRTSDKIRAFAIRALEGFNVDDLDGGEDSQEGYVSLIQGNEPVIKVHDTFSEEIQTIISYLNSSDTLNQTCLVARTNTQLEHYEKALTASGFTTYKLSRSTAEDRYRDGVRLATMHRVKGLEFERVIIAGLNHDMMPLRQAIEETDDELVRESRIIQERALFYVACTRAKKDVLLTTSGKASELIV